MREKNVFYFNELPEGYREIHLYDIEGRKFRILTGPVSFAVSLMVAALVFLFKVGFILDGIHLSWNPLYLLHILTVIGIVLAYTVIHELTHGLVYWLFTRRRLSFGFVGSMAYCGVPGIYVKRDVAAASCIAPFVIYTAVYLVLLAALPVNVFWIVLLITFMNHLGGCFADIYAFVVMMKNGRDLLMEDNGRDQHVFVKQ